VSSRRTTLPAIELRVGEWPRLNPEFPSSLEAFQEFVGGNIDCITLPPAFIAVLERVYGIKFGPRTCICVNDEFLMNGSEPNLWATSIARSACVTEVICGSALICDVP
jgi:hypothetical protein